VIKESKLWQQVKASLSEHKPKWTQTRIETWSLPGVPDVMLCDVNGNFHLVELKVVTGYAVKLSPHQVSFAQNHAHASVWLLAWKDEEYYLYKAAEIVNVAEKGLKHIPFIRTKDLFWILHLISPH